MRDAYYTRARVIPLNNDCSNGRRLVNGRAVVAERDKSIVNHDGERERERERWVLERF